MPALIAFAVAAAIGVAILSWHLKAQRRKDIAAVAARMKLQYSPDDPFELHRRPFALMRRGDGRGAENVMWGKASGLEVIAFDYWYYEESSDAKGNRSRSYHRFSCAVMPVHAWAPPLTIQPETFLTRIADHIGLRDIEFESEEFNRAFNVTCEDRKFASALVDPRMMQWLLMAHDYSFDLSGPQLLCYIGRLRPRKLPVLLQVAKGFRDHIPTVVSDLYPPAGTEAAQ